MIDFVRALQGFVTGDVNKPANAVGYYNIISHPLHVVKTAIYAIQTILGDAVLVGGVVLWITNGTNQILYISGLAVLRCLQQELICCDSCRDDSMRKPR